MEFFLIGPVRGAFLDKWLFQRDRRVEHSFEGMVENMRYFGFVRPQLVQQGEVA